MVPPGGAAFSPPAPRGGTEAECLGHRITSACTKASALPLGVDRKESRHMDEEPPEINPNITFWIGFVLGAVLATVVLVLAEVIG